MQLVFDINVMLLAKVEEGHALVAPDESFQRVDRVVGGRSMEADHVDAGQVDALLPLIQAEGGNVVGIDHDSPFFFLRRHLAREEHLGLMEIRILVIGRDQGIPENISAGGLSLEDAHPESAVQVHAQRLQFLA